MTNYTDLRFAFWLLFYFLTPLTFSMMTSGVLFLIHFLGLSLTQWSEIGQAFGGIFGTIAATVSVYYLYKSFAEMKEQSKSMMNSSIIEAMNKYQENGKARIDQHRINVAQLIIDELTESIMKEDKFKDYDKPCFLLYKDPYKKAHSVSTVYPNTIKIYKDKNIPLDNLFFNDNRFEYTPVFHKSINEIIIAIPDSIRDFEFKIFMVSNFSKRKWMQKIGRKEGEPYITETTELKK